jgi:hypothetical protein
MLKRVIIEPDPDPESPCREDGFRVVSFIDRLTTYENPENYIEVTGRGQFRPATIGLRRKIAGQTAFWLSYFEHGEGAWSLMGEGAQCRWDTTMLAGVLLYGGKASNIRRENRAEQARLFLETYNEYFNGHVYAWTIEDMDGNVLDGCCGYYGGDHLVAGLNDVLKPDDVVVLDGEFRFVLDYDHDKLDCAEVVDEGEFEERAEAARETIALNSKG